MELYKQIKYLGVASLISLLFSCGGQNLNSQTMEEKHAYTNDLINETSAYLLQHAHNPVDWMPWGEEAFEKARLENKLVLISVGYAACHWCHVMEHESFEDTVVAEIMNDNFVCIKVDREERPDVDNIYMTAVQLITGRGGWPLNAFALPDGRPFYGGTYFPKDQWVNVLNSLIDTYKNKPDEIEKYAEQLAAGIKQVNIIDIAEGEPEFSISTLNEMVLNWSRKFDGKEGGLNYSPKFPIPNNLIFLLRYGALLNNDKAINHVNLTLKRMAYGGIYDQIGGGFTRYSTDMFWKVPHFEKMLYDNGQMVSLYAEAFQATKNPLYREIVYETIEFINRELSHPDGGFYSSLDADSEGEEGKFYVWNVTELGEILNEEEFRVCEEYYNLNRKGLWEHDNYILLRDKDDEVVAKELGISVEEMNKTVQSIKKKLLKVRESRIRPGLDDKILTSWNALMIGGLTDAARIFNDDELLKLAESQMAFILEKQLRSDGGLNHNYKEGTSNINGYLEDYSFVIEALIKLYESTFNEEYLQKALKLTDYTFTHFFDDNSKMFYFTSDEDAPLVARSYETSDNVIPASNSAMARNLFYLGHYYYNNDFLDKSKTMLHNVQKNFLENGSSYSNWGILMLHQTQPYFEVAITGKKSLDLMHDMESYYVPNKLLMGAEKSSKLPLLEGKFFDHSMVFVCVDKSCQMPVEQAEDAIKQMR
jgi:uncharacterized protein YyaL (SSP411 family)